MLRDFYDFIARFIAWIKKNQRINPTDNIVKVNIGSSLSVADGWINVDVGPSALLSKWPRLIRKILYRFSSGKGRYSQDQYCEVIEKHIFVHHNLLYGLPFPDEFIDYLYSSHSLEHFYKDDAVKLLKETFRVLLKGGIIRICVPDLEKAITLYQQEKKEDALAYFYSPSKSGYFGRHLYMYDFDLLNTFLRNVGFVNIKRCSYQQGKTPDIDILDVKPEESLYVEAMKPRTVDSGKGMQKTDYLKVMLEDGSSEGDTK